jgi:hypothetical protein
VIGSDRMAKDVNGTGMVYKADEGTWSVYELWYENRVVLEAAVDNADSELKIFVGYPGSSVAQAIGTPDAMIATNGIAKKGLHEVGGTEDSPGDLKDHIDGVSVQSYVLPRAIRFMADLYVPKV